MWRLKGRSRLGILGCLHTPSTKILPEFHEQIEKQIPLKAKVGAWRVYNLGGDVELFIYRKRFIVCRRIDLKDEPMDERIRTTLGVKDHWLRRVQELLPLEDELKYTLLPFVFTDQVEFDEQNDWIGDGITSFNYRIYDSDTERAGVVRISRHMLVCAGLSDAVLQDVVNLTYEKLLNVPKAIEHADVFNFVDGLSRYTLPSELNIYIQKAVLRAAIFTAVITLSVSLISTMVSLGPTDGWGALLKLALIPATLLVAKPAWDWSMKFKLNWFKRRT